VQCPQLDAASGCVASGSASNEEPSVRTHRDAGRKVVEAEGAHESTAEREHLDALVFTVGNVQIAGVHCNTFWEVELERRGASFADGSEVAQWRDSKDADTVIVTIRDIETINVAHSKLAVARKRPVGAVVLAAAHQCKALGKEQVPVAEALLADAVHTPAVADPQLLHTVVVAVGDEEVRAVCREALWFFEVARRRATATDDPKCSARSVQVTGAEEQYASVGSIGHGKPAVIW